MSARKQNRIPVPNTSGPGPTDNDAFTKNWPADHVERRSVNSLVPYARNARTHSAGQIAQLAASIREWGWTTPVLIDEAGGLIAGHGRVLAARLLGLDDVPAMTARGWSESKRKAYILADNRLALDAGWDEAMLACELNDLAAEAFDMSLIGFSVDELAELSADRAAGLTDPDEAPEPPTLPVARHGDVWNCGAHRVLCGDATLMSDLKTIMDGEVADVCFTDPPYNVNYSNRPADKLHGTNRPILNDALGGAFGGFLNKASINILAVTTGGIYICMSSSELDTLQRAFRDAGGKWSTFVIWAKSSFTIGRSDCQRQYEPILYGWKESNDHYWCGARNQGDVWLFDKPHKNDLHPTMKPVALVERAIGNSSKADGIVLDPFGGSGTTMIAASRLGRRARLVELDPKYVDVILARWEAFTGEQATLKGDDRTFAEIARERLKSEV
jgi:DNA modification methylase